MGSLSDYSENELLDHVFNAAYTASSTIYLALCTADPTDAATGASMNETANSNAYARTAIVFGAAASRRVTQSGDVSFPEATGTYGAAITHWAIVDSATYGAGNVLAHGAFNSSFTPVSGNTVTVPSTSVYVEIQATSGGAGYSDYTVHNWLDLMFRNQAFTKPSTYVGLSNTTLNDQDVTDADFTEVAGTGYARVQVNINGGASPTWDLSSGGAISNTHLVTFPTVGAGNWTQLVSAVVVDSASGACNILCYDNDNVIDQTPQQNDVVRFPVGDLDLTLS